VAGRGHIGAALIMPAIVALVAGPAEQAPAVEKTNSDARFTALRTSLLVVALVAIVALFSTGMIPVKPVGQPAGSVPADSAADGSPDDGRMDGSAEILGLSTAAGSAGP
jgi:hypothetical protein